MVQLPASDMYWQIKGVTQRVLSVVPSGVRINDVLQRTVGGLRRFDRQVASKIRDDWLVFAANLREIGIKPASLRYLEIGTGWYPTLPTCFVLSGASCCMTFDLIRHLNSRLTQRMLKQFPVHLPAIADAAQRDLADVEADYKRFQGATDISEFLAHARIEYHAPADATATGLLPESIDVVFSNSVLEHVPREVIRGIMMESRRVLRPGGVSIHSVNCGDHYAYFDRKITPINYLAYSENAWQFWNNDLCYQNRMRPQDFLEMAEDEGLEIVLRKQKPRQELLSMLPQLKIAPEFNCYSPAELCTTSIDFAARKP